MFLMEKKDWGVVVISTSFCFLHSYRENRPFLLLSRYSIAVNIAFSSSIPLDFWVLVYRNAWQPVQEKFVEIVVLLSHLFVELFQKFKLLWNSNILWLFRDLSQGQHQCSFACGPDPFKGFWLCLKKNQSVSRRINSNFCS